MNGRRSLSFLTLLIGSVFVSLTLRSTPSCAIAIPGRVSSTLLSLHGRDEKRQRSASGASLSALTRAQLHLPLAMAIPGYGLAEQVFVGGFSNFLQVYNLVITARILLSWFPQAQGIGVLQPVFAITDPYLNLFRGIIPPIGGFDLSPLAAFFVLNVAGQVTSALGCEMPESQQSRGMSKKRGMVGPCTVPHASRRVPFYKMK